MIVSTNDLYENIEFIDSFGHDGSLIFKAATTCYRSEETTKKTTKQFIDMLQHSGHLSMIEMMWFPIRIYFKSKTRRRNKINILAALDTVAAMSNYIELTIDEDSEFAIISGNARAWRDLFTFSYRNKLNLDKWDKAVLKSILCAIREVHTQIYEEFCFTEECKSIDDYAYVNVIKNNADIPEEHYIHRWQFVKFHNVSRGLTHELVRHRTMSFAQASTRYINNSNFDVLFDEDEAFANLEFKHDMKYTVPFKNLEREEPIYISGSEEHERVLKINQNIMSKQFNDRLVKLMQETKDLYSDMVNANVAKNHARQILPTGILNEICIAGRMTDWEHLFELRTSGVAHWEIRKIAKLLQKIFRKHNL